MKEEKIKKIESMGGGEEVQKSSNLAYMILLKYIEVILLSFS